MIFARIRYSHDGRSMKSSIVKVGSLYGSKNDFYGWIEMGLPYIEVGIK